MGISQRQGYSPDVTMALVITEANMYINISLLDMSSFILQMKRQPLSPKQHVLVGRLCLHEETRFCM